MVDTLSLVGNTLSNAVTRIRVSSRKDLQRNFAREFTFNGTSVDKRILGPSFASHLDIFAEFLRIYKSIHQQL